MNHKTYKILTVIYMALLLWVASLSYSSILGTTTGHKVFYNGLHIPMYAVLTYLCIRSHRLIDLQALKVSALFAIAYGGFIEWYQGFVPNRTSSLSDVGLNTIGILLVTFYVYQKNASIRSQSHPPEAGRQDTRS